MFIMIRSLYFWQLVANLSAGAEQFQEILFRPMLLNIERVNTPRGTWHVIALSNLMHTCRRGHHQFKLSEGRRPHFISAGWKLFFFSTISRRIEIWLTIADNNQPWLVLLGNLFLRVTITAHLWTGSLIRRNPHLIPVDVAKYSIGPSILEFLIFQDQVWFFKTGI